MRGDLYRLRDNTEAKGHEQRGARYAVVLQSDSLFGSTVLSAPTSRSAKAASYRPEITVGGTVTRVLVEQLTAFDPERRFGKRAGRLTREEAQRVDQALRLVLGLFD